MGAPWSTLSELTEVYHMAHLTPSFVAVLVSAGLLSACVADDTGASSMDTLESSTDTPTETTPQGPATTTPNSASQAAPPTTSAPPPTIDPPDSQSNTPPVTPPNAPPASNGGTTAQPGNEGGSPSGGSGPIVGIGGAMVDDGMGGMMVDLGMGGTVDDGMGGMIVVDPGMGGMGIAGMAAGGSGTAGMPMVGGDDLNSGENTMGWVGCSMGENTAIGYRRIGGTRMWGSNGNGGAVVQQWTSGDSAAWGRFDNMANQYGKPVAVWIMICIFAQAGATAQEVNAMIENARNHSAENVTIYLTGQPVYTNGHVCTLAGSGGPEMTDELAKEVADQHDDVIYPGQLVLQDGEVAADTCHANTEGEDALGRQAKAYWGQP
jgi:hypothetical protein